MSEADGELIGGRYRLIEPVGVGGMGRVWRGRDELLDREVAVKEILFPQGMDAVEWEVFGKRAMREARSAARLNHPGIVTVHDVITRDGAPVIVMEFVRGLSLDQRIKRQGRLAPVQVARIGAMMVEALGEAHAAGIVHRDLKPANVLLPGNRVVITDFGIAGLAGDATLTTSGVLIGTPAFMAPEQVHGLPVTAACDLWSLGATLYAAAHQVYPHPSPGSHLDPALPSGPSAGDPGALGSGERRPGGGTDGPGSGQETSPVPAAAVAPAPVADRSLPRRRVLLLLHSEATWQPFSRFPHPEAPDNARRASDADRLDRGAILEHGG
ncbi:serine/threonine-protein kinase [Streptosporangium subroseum]|uniref:serine/threonine-protein kinase n=1 Tax=Streptosporangium subroseum TaxID=106412 RepID=UPI00342EB3E6